MEAFNFPQFILFFVIENSKMYYKLHNLKYVYKFENIFLNYTIWKHIPKYGLKNF